MPLSYDLSYALPCSRYPSVRADPVHVCLSVCECVCVCVCVLRKISLVFLAEGMSVSRALAPRSSSHPPLFFARPQRKWLSQLKTAIAASGGGHGTGAPVFVQDDSVSDVRSVVARMAPSCSSAIVPGSMRCLVVQPRAFHSTFVLPFTVSAQLPTTTLSIYVSPWLSPSPCLSVCLLASLIHIHTHARSCLRPTSPHSGACYVRPFGVRVCHHSAWCATRSFP